MDRAIMEPISTRAAARGAPAREIPFFAYPRVFEAYEKSFVQALQEVGRRGGFIMQADLQEFEGRLAAFVGSRHAVGVANATDGLQMALMAGGLEPGGEVIISSHTMVATAASVHFAGLRPVPVDAGRDHLIDPAAVERAVTERTVAICPTQLNGRTCDMDRLQAIADRYDLPIYEDAAQALGSRFRDRCAGTFGVAGCISFYPAKVLGCLGDGGAVLTDDPAVCRTLLALRDHGRTPDGNVAMWGLNSRLDNLQAAFLNVQLGDFESVIARRRQLAGRYADRLQDCASLRLPPAPNAEGPHFDVFQNYEIQAAGRDHLQAFLKRRGVGTLVQWNGIPIHQHTGLGFEASLPRTDRLFERLLMLPLNMSLTDADVDYVCDQILEFYADSNTD